MTKLKAKKIKMTQVWKEDKVIPVTVLEVINDESNVLDSIKDKEGIKVNVRGKSKGKGFQGVVKRYNFAGAPATHGQKHTLRTGGSIGATDPQRVFPGKKMPGRMGNQNITVKNLRVIEVRSEDKVLLVKGAVPGMNGSGVEIIANI